MAKTIFEEMGVTYSSHGEYNLPDIALLEQKNYHIGKYGRIREKYLKEHRRVTYLNLLTSCTLYEHLANIDAKAATAVKTKNIITKGSKSEIYGLMDPKNSLYELKDRDWESRDFGTKTIVFTNVDKIKIDLFGANNEYNRVK